MNIVLYALTVLIWGTTWIAIKFQLGVVAVPVAVAWRFWIAGAIQFALLVLRREKLTPPRELWLPVLLQGLALFSCNLVCVYYAEQWIASGLVAVIFSTAPLWSALAARLFFGRAIARRTIAGAALGLGGIALLFLPQWSGRWNDAATLRGLAFTLAGTICFAAGGLLSIRMRESGASVWVTNTWAMFAGAAVLTVAAISRGLPFSFAPTVPFTGALLYLAIPGSVVVFTAYLTLVHRIGPERAAYATVLFPVVALTVSTFAEGYAWSAPAIAGLALVIAGNVMVFARSAVQRP